MSHVTRRVLAVVTTMAAMAPAALAISVVTAAPAQAASSGLCSYTSSEPVLRRGSTGTAVKQAQCELNYSMTGDNLAIDGDFGPATESAVKRFQACVKISVDGVIGPVTWSHLNYWASNGGYPSGC